MFKVGLTGGIASGKSSVAKWFIDKGITVIDADRIVHELFSRTSLVKEIGRVFGSGYLENGSINRTLLGSTVFRNPGDRRRLERIIHPLVRQEMQDKANKAELNKEKLVIFDIPLLLEAGWEKDVEEVWVVYVRPEIQLDRLMLRNGLSASEAEMRISSQLPLDEKVKKSHRVIDNSGSWDNTEKQLAAIWKELIDKTGSFNGV